MFRSRSWFGGGGGRDSNNGVLWKPKNPHSLEYLKYLHGVLSKNQSVSESNKPLLVETLRSISEILIWGDQNDSTVFDFFLEKNMLSYFLQIMKQKCGSYVCVQLLQTLNILFENIRNETSLYYLLSNNHVNSIIEHKFDFSDEEVMAYYISFLKTLSFKLNSHTINFFYNEHTHDFPLYTEAIKFFNNSESMVRIAVRTLTLNVYKVDDKSMLDFIRDKTAAPYFSNLVWFIGNHVVEIDQAIKKCSSNDEDQKKNNNCRLDDLVAEHLDHLHYVNDILLLGIEDLNNVLVDHLLNRLFLPVYLGGLEKDKQKELLQDHLSVVLSLFLLSQVFTIVTHSNLLENLSDALLQNNILNLIDCTENDYGTFYALTLVWAVFKKFYPANKEVVENEKVKSVFYNCDGGVNDELVRRIVSNVVSNAVKFDSKVRLVTVSMATTLLFQILDWKKIQLPDRDLALLESHREENILSMQNYYKSEEMFLEIFEDEYLSGRDYSLENLLQDSALLLPPVGSPLSFVAIDRRRPCGEGERCRRSMRVYFVLRSLSLELRKEKENYLPLTDPRQCVGIEENLDLTNSDLLACTVVSRVEGTKLRRFLVVDTFQLILVEPSHKQMGWGVAKFVGFLQDLEVLVDSNDSRCLHITVKSSPISLMKKIKEAKSNNGRNYAQNSAGSSGPILAAKFVFDDHIRCLAARQRLVKGRLRARERKLSLIGRLLDQQHRPSSSSSPPQRIRNYRPSSNNRQPGVAVPSIQPGASLSSTESNNRRRRSPRPRSSSSQMVVSEIPLEDRQPSSSSVVSQDDNEGEAKVETSFVATATTEETAVSNNRKKGEIMDV